MNLTPVACAPDSAAGRPKRVTGLRAEAACARAAAADPNVAVTLPAAWVLTGDSVAAVPNIVVATGLAAND